MSAIVDINQEVIEVSLKLESAVEALYSPLRELARSQLDRNRPLLRAAWVLAIGMDVDDLSMFQPQRIYLATAVEMLRIAILLHKLLLDSDMSASDSTPDKPILGSAILTGDYCFGQAAALAAQTDNTIIVQLFAQALKSISEGQLRRLFQAAGHFDSTKAAEEYHRSEDDHLFLTGGRAACLLGRRDGAEIIRQIESMSFSPESLRHFAERYLQSAHLTPLQQHNWRWFITFNG